jgi:hypothetical protein
MNILFHGTPHGETLQRSICFVVRGFLGMSRLYHGPAYDRNEKKRGPFTPSMSRAKGVPVTDIKPEVAPPLHRTRRAAE